LFDSGVNNDIDVLYRHVSFTSTGIAATSPERRCSGDGQALSACSYFHNNFNLYFVFAVCLSINY